MPTKKEVQNSLKYWLGQIDDIRNKLNELRPESFLDERKYEERQGSLNEEIKNCQLEIDEVLERFERTPHRHSVRHGERLEVFHKKAPYEKSVFVMTKYPQGRGKAAKGLKLVIKTVEDTIHDNGFVPRIAADRDHHRWLWDNVELYLLGCSRGVAIVEDKYLQELNPNVAMEWGWMTAMGREVLFLKEKSFNHERADWKGLMSYDFDWDNPSVEIKTAIDKFLQDNGV